MSILNSWKLKRNERQIESGYYFAILNLLKERITIEMLKDNIYLDKQACNYDHFDVGIQEALDDYEELVNKISTFKN